MIIHNKKEIQIDGIQFTLDNDVVFNYLTGLTKTRVEHELVLEDNSKLLTLILK